jgi:hypothetical protein
MIKFNRPCMVVIPLIPATWEAMFKDHSLRPAWAKSYRNPISTSKQSVVYICNPSYTEGHS